MSEVWKDIVEYEGLYKISNFGNVKTLRYNRLLTPIFHKGYLGVTLAKNKINKQLRIHRIVAVAFLSNYEEKTQVNHKNGIKSDNRVENLEWCSPKENTKHSWDNGFFNNDNKRKQVRQLDKTGNLIKIWESGSKAAECLKIHATAINRCCRKVIHNNSAGGFRWEFNF